MEVGGGKKDEGAGDNNNRNLKADGDNLVDELELAGKGEVGDGEEVIDAKVLSSALIDHFDVDQDGSSRALIQVKKKLLQVLDRACTASLTRNTTPPQPHPHPPNSYCSATPSASRRSR